MGVTGQGEAGGGVGSAAPPGGAHGVGGGVGSGRRRAARAAMVLAAATVCLLALGSTPVRAAPAPGAGPAAGAGGAGWVWPLEGPPPVTRVFAPPAQRYGAGHRGVDLGAPPAAVVRAAGPGRVTYAGLLAGRGVVVVVHGELRTTYEPVLADVATGEPVAAGQALGRLAAGHAGCPVAACLHWGLRRGEQYLDPLSLVGAGPVRLLPLDGPAAGPIGASGSNGPGSNGSGSSGTGDPAVPADRPPGQGAGWQLRSAASPTGALAVVALLTGLALLARPRTPPAGPAAAAGEAGAAAGAPAGRGAEPAGVRPAQDVVDLERERLRRRASG